MSEGYWDIHNHILPGVDDGSSCMEETMLLLEEEYCQGVRRIVFTPHYRPGMFDVPADERERAFADVCARFQADYPDMRFYLGCEMHVSRHLFEDLHDSRCRMGAGRTVLLEFDGDSSYKIMQSVVAHAVRMGCRPLLAHVERYEAMYTDTARRIRALQEAGAWIQINAGSVLGAGGRQEMRFCELLLIEALVDVVASDAHNMTNRPILMQDCARTVDQMCGPEAVEVLFKRNPSRLMRGAKHAKLPSLSYT